MLVIHLSAMPISLLAFGDHHSAIADVEAVVPWYPKRVAQRAWQHRLVARDNSQDPKAAQKTNPTAPICIANFAVTKLSPLSLITPYR